MTGNTPYARLADYLKNAPDDLIDVASGFTRADGLAILQILDAAHAAIVAPPLSAGSWNGGP